MSSQHPFIYLQINLWVCKPMKPGIKFGQHFKASIRHTGRDNIHISWNCLLSCQEFSYRAHEIKQTDVNNFSVTLFSFLFPQWASLVTQRSRGLWVWKIPWGRNWQPTPVFLRGKSHGPRNLVGYSPWGRERVRYDLATTQHSLSICHNTWHMVSD